MRSQNSLIKILRKEMCKKKLIYFFFYFVRLLQKNKNSACFTSFALKCLNFARILENFAQSCYFTSSAFRSSVFSLCKYRQPMQVRHSKCLNHHNQQLCKFFLDWRKFGAPNIWCCHKKKCLIFTLFLFNNSSK